MGHIHAKYLRATSRQAGQDVDAASLTPWDYRADRTANRIALILEVSFRHAVYGPLTDEYLHDANILWVHGRRSALFALRIGAQEDANRFAHIAIAAAKAFGMEDRLASFILLLANQGHHEARSMVESFHPGSRERRELEEVFTICAQKEEAAQPP